MVLNQLFNEKPKHELVLSMILKFGLKGFNDKTEFTILDLDKHNTLLSIKNIENDIKNAYIPCKRAKFAETFTNKSLITILRQFLKMYDYDLYSREKFIKGRKYLSYKIVSKKDKQFLSIKNKKYVIKKEVTIDFD